MTTRQPRSVSKLSCCTIALLGVLACRSIITSLVAPSSSSASVEVFPDKVALPYGEVDDLLVGRSCVYDKRIGALAITFKFLPWTNPWICRECSPETGCRRLERRGRCRPFGRYLDSGSKDEIPRVLTSYSPYTSSRSAVAVYHHDGHQEYSQEYPICGALLTPPCFDLSRCVDVTNDANRSGGPPPPLRVYSHGGVVDNYLDYAMRHYPETIIRVHNASEACLLVVGQGAYNQPRDLLHSPHWNHGKNHFVFESDRLFGSHGDRPFNDKTSFGMAAVSAVSMDDAYVREGYDMPYSLDPHWLPPRNFNRTMIEHRSRRYLLSFKGNIFPWEQRSWQHRWIAAEYWTSSSEESDNDDVHVDVTCESSRNMMKLPYKNTTAANYGDILLDSTFSFCPGGGGVSSFRFAESLLAGAIPMVTSDFLPPFHPELDWSGCIVRVSDARVVDAPRIARKILDDGEDELAKRRRRCADLADLVFGDPSGPSRDDDGKVSVLVFVGRRMFSTAMRIWHVRIQNALRRRDELALVG